MTTKHKTKARRAKRIGPAKKKRAAKGRRAGEETSARVAKLAGQILRDPKATEAQKAVAASALTQVVEEAVARDIGDGLDRRAAKVAKRRKIRRRSR